MCGIIGYIGKREALPIILEGLSRLEYRGYDSAGVAILNGSSKKNIPTVGKISLLQDACSNMKLPGTLGIGHTRWATHGKPSERNTHPHADCTKNIFIAHNGIIENYQTLKEALIKRHHVFTSETDSEVIAHLIEENYQKEKNLEKAVLKTLKSLKGTYGLMIASSYEPDKIIAARMGAPVLLGLGDGENFIASDASAVLAHTKTVLYLNDGEIAVITPHSHKIFTLGNKSIKRAGEEIEWDIDQIKKGGFEHFTLKEIMEQPETIKNTLRGRLLVKDGLAKLGGIEAVTEKLRLAKKIQIVACGTALNASRVGEYMLEEYAGIPTEIDYASEFRYRKPVLDEHTVLIAVSQSGETADTLEAMREGKRKGALILGIVNVVGSTIARESDAGIYNHAGPELSVVSTKVFISQLVVFALLTLFLGRQRGLSLSTGKRIAEELEALPDKIEKILSKRNEIKKIAKKYAKYENFLFLGRKYSFPIALEGAMKLKESSYLHAEGVGAGEMKHGPIAMIDKNFPSVFIAPEDSVHEKVISNMQEIKARDGKVLAIATEKDNRIAKIADDVIYIPKTLEMLTPILSVIPLQLFAYYLAVARGQNPDRPRNMAKSVTVE